jgi:uncharacterized protein
MSDPCLLYVTQVAPYRDGPAGVHGVLDQSAVAVAELAESAGLAFRRVTDVRDLEDDALSTTAVIGLFTIGETPWSDRQRAALLDRVRTGRTGVLAIHSATDSCHTWDDYRLLVGARFAGHPWTREMTVDVTRRDHPAVSHFGSSFAWHDEVYLFSGLRPDADILLSARPSEFAQPGEESPVPDIGIPLSWCFTEGDGRVFSTSLGHFPHAWETPDYLRHLAGGLDWLQNRPG